MTPPPIRRYSHGDRVYVRAQQVWMILAAHVMNTSGKFSDRLLTYGDLARHHWRILPPERPPGAQLHRREPANRRTWARRCGRQEQVVA
jgi:hypothetical protein